MSAELPAGDSVVLLVDWQERLCAAMPPDVLAANQRKAEILLDGARAAGVPVLASEQYPQGLGPTVASLRERLDAERPAIEKRDFSCADVPEFVFALAALGRRSVVLAGMESHICVFQTARGLRRLGYEVAVATDAVVSRRKADFRAALGLYDACGAVPTSVEAVLFDWVRRAEGDVFKAVSRLVR
jgi:nicotinamidase-related amidase